MDLEDLEKKIENVQSSLNAIIGIQCCRIWKKCATLTEFSPKARLTGQLWDLAGLAMLVGKLLLKLSRMFKKDAEL